jgi:predicted regulator of Ras-like GTPase activity (Roadblock/LC7/MglB family)
MRAEPEARPMPTHRRPTPPRLVPLALFALAFATPVAAQPVGTAFAYQGQLQESGQPANGLYDLQFCLYPDASTPTPIACLPDFDDVPIEAGLFTVALDFGSAAFVGQQRFIELRVRPGAATGAHTALAPRQRVRAVPEALRAESASAAPWTGLSGVPAGFADGVDNTGGNGTVTSIRVGTGLVGGTITDTGTIAIANGGVGAAQIATGAVGASQLAPGAVGLAQIDAAQVQRRIGGTCAVGEYFRGIAADGSVACEPVPGVPRITVLEDVDNIVGVYASIAIGADGLPVIAHYDDTANALKVAKCANAACTQAAAITVVDDPANDVGLFASIAIGADGRPIVSYYDITAGALKVAHCANPSCTGSATVSVVDDPAGSAGWASSIAIGANGLPVIAHHDATAGTLRLSLCGNAACSTPATNLTLDGGASFVGAYTSLAIGADGVPVVAYYDTTARSLKVAHCANAACTGAPTLSTVDDPANNVGLWASMAIGADGRPVIAYWDLSAQTLKVAKCANAGCSNAATITVVDDPVNAVGEHATIEVGTDGLPVIGYYDATADALKVARCNNAACSSAPAISTVDQPGADVGRWASLAIGTDGLPVLAYFDNTRGALRVAKCGTRSCP